MHHTILLVICKTVTYVIICTLLMIYRFLRIFKEVARLSQIKFQTTLQVNDTQADLTLWFDGEEVQFRRDESLLNMMEKEGIVKQVFPMHGTIFYKFASCLTFKR